MSNLKTAIVGIGESRVGSVPDRSALQLQADAAQAALADAGLKMSDIDGLLTTPVRVEHWNIPTDTGRRAGAVLAAYLAGEGYSELVDAHWDLLPSFWSDQFDIRLQSYGMPGLADPDGIRLLEGSLDDECVIGYHRGDELVGVVGIGMIRIVNSYRDKVGHLSST